MEPNWRTWRAGLHSLVCYRELLEQPVLSHLLTSLDSLAKGEGLAALEGYTEMLFRLHRAGYEALGQWLHDQLRYGDLTYPMAVSRDADSPRLRDSAKAEIELFCQLSTADWWPMLLQLKQSLPAEFVSAVGGLPDISMDVAPFDLKGIMGGYIRNGAGQFAQHRAFLWRGGNLEPVAKPDCLRETQLLGYTKQRQQVVDNTRAFLEGRGGNDVLLYGDSGTGKSATVKSLLAIPDFEKLRLIEVQKDGLDDLSGLIRHLSQQPQHFILFIDDLAFDQDDKTYALVKTMLEGGLEQRPGNVAIYATSNRRLLVRQTFSDRAGDEVDMKETIQEKSALSDRFGLRIAYLNLTKKEFFNLVEAMAKQNGLDIDRAELLEKAALWDMRVPGRTPRVAKQFIASLG